ncbi:MAG: TetR/AcrR family transcriptional regulator [Lewinella sp.]|uniref:TetR/AcrR family transcriptional regulator n=1 Tax=Lewinella TaxID=70994 RepID=UPI0005C51E54|nr:TetR/AcrR family transcriptional regulator [Lewinella cohaerens]
MATIETSKKQRIMEAAAKLFRDRGYSATSMRDLAKAVHLQASSLYSHINSKQEILKDICFQNAHRFLAGIEQIEQTGQPPREQIRQLIFLHLNVATSDATSITAFNDEWRHLEEPDLGQFIKLRKRYENRFLAIIQQGITEGTFKEIDPTISMYTILSSLRWVYDWYQAGKTTSIQDVGDQITLIVLAGIEK